MKMCIFDNLHFFSLHDFPITVRQLSELIDEFRVYKEASGEVMLWVLNLFFGR